MEELSIEEKAKRYDKALENAKYYHSEMGDDVKCVLEEAFSELRESEDEGEDDRIRRALLNTVKYYHFKESPYMFGISKEQVIAWLEKQGEKTNPYSGTSFEYNGHVWGMCARDNGVEIGFDGELKAFLSPEKSFIYPIHPKLELAPKCAMEAIKEEKVDNKNCVKLADKVEPKFKVGDYIAEYYCRGRVVALTDDSYLLDTGQGIPFSCEDNIHLWTIADAKDGDVLREDTCIFIIKEMKSEDTATIHCCLFDDGDFDLSLTLGFDVDSTYPATKEQRNALMEAMAEAGYEWDAEKKELKKVGQELTALAKGEDYGIDGLYAAVDIDAISLADECDDFELRDWLKSLKP